MTTEEKAEMIRAMIETFGEDATRQVIATLNRADRDELEKEFASFLAMRRPRHR